jgi:hypothetical protein
MVAEDTAFFVVILDAMRHTRRTPKSPRVLCILVVACIGLSHRHSTFIHRLADDGVGVLVYKMTVGNTHAGTRAQKLRSAIPMDRGGGRARQTARAKAYPKDPIVISILLLSTRSMHADLYRRVPSFCLLIFFLLPTQSWSRTLMIKSFY